MSNSGTVRIGIIGMGNMGNSHAQKISAGKVPNLKLTAVADRDPVRLEKFEGVKKFAEGTDLINSGEVDAVLIASPHFAHTTLGIAALEAGLHTMVEKPLSVDKADCERLLAAHTDENVVFAVMLNQRTNPCYKKLRQLINNGELGEIQRINWIITDWYRTESYFATSSWRATWVGDGGGVLLNQCPHQLDLMWWLFGMPSRITANCQFGRFHDIECEDAVTALLEYPNGATGVFITSTGEAPGTNRLEVAADRGKVVIENGKFSYTRNEVPISEHIVTEKGGFIMPESWDVEIPVSGDEGEQHVGILKSFTNAILKGTELISPAVDGMYSVEIGNAMILSAVEDRPIDMPMDSAAFAKVLKEKVAGSSFREPVGDGGVEDLEGTF